MKIRAGLVAIVLFLSAMEAQSAFGATPTFAQFIQAKGTAYISDGSSLFTFSKDGSFSQEPLEISGRTVQGKWTTDQQGGLFTIKGNWGWINGISPLSDSRKMIHLSGTCST